LRKAVNISRDPFPWLARRLAAYQLRLQGLPPLRIDANSGYVLIPKNFIKNIDQIVDTSLRVWRKHRDRIAGEKNYFLKLSRYIDVAEFRDVVDATLQENVVKLAADYLGGIPILDKLDLWWTRPWNRPEGAQNYHLDSIPDTRSIRFLIAMTDIDEESGPLHFLPANKSAQLIRKIGYLGGVIGPEIIERELGSDAIMLATSPSGAGIAFDAGRCFHLGSRNMKRDRLVLSFSFCSWYVNEKVNDKSMWCRPTAQLTSLQKSVLNVR
jgi:hypothetical protein